MNKFSAEFSEQIEGAISGFDRLVFRGSLRAIAYELGDEDVLWHSQVLLKDFGSHVEKTSQALKAAATEVAQRAGRPVQFLRSQQVSKEEIARQIAARDQIHTGLVCVLTSVKPVNYYWTTYQSEWAMDLIFRPAEPFRRLYPKLVQLGMTSFSSAAVMRFLGKKTTLQGNVPGTLTAAVCSDDLKRRPEGVRFKHSLGINSVKLYDKAYTPHTAVLRAEITINAAEQFRVYRPKEGDPQGPDGVAQHAARYCQPAPSCGSLPASTGRLLGCLSQRGRQHHAGRT